MCIVDCPNILNLQKVRTHEMRQELTVDEYMANVGVDMLHAGMVSFEIGDAENASFEDESFDIVMGEGTTVLIDEGGDERVPHRSARSAAT